MTAIDFTTYDGLCAAAAQWLNRRDLTDQIPGFIKLAEPKFNRVLRVRDMQARASATSSDEYVALPGDWLQTHSLEIATGDTRIWGEPLRFVSEEDAKRMRAENPTSTDTRCYTIWGNSIELVHAPAEPYSFNLKYFQRIPALGSSNQSNWLLAKHPDIYLYGTLLEAAPYLKNDDRIATWAGFWQRIVDDINLESERAMRPSGALSANRRSFG